MLEQRPAEIVAETEIRSIDEVSALLGDLAMPEEPKQAYAYLADDGQLVMERFATNFDHLAIPID